MKSICDCEKYKKYDALPFGSQCCIINDDQSTRRMMKNCIEHHIVEDECFMFLEYVDSFELKLQLAETFWHFNQQTRLRLISKTSIDPFLMPNLFTKIYNAFHLNGFIDDKSTDFLAVVDSMSRDVRAVVLRGSPQLWHWYPGLRRTFYEAFINGRFEKKDGLNTLQCRIWDVLFDLANELFPKKVRLDLNLKY